MTTLDGKWLGENERMAMLRAEEHEALGMWEVPNNALISARLSMRQAPIAPLPDQKAKKAPSATNVDYFSRSLEALDGTLLIVSGT